MLATDHALHIRTVEQRQKYILSCFPKCGKKGISYTFSQEAMISGGAPIIGLLVDDERSTVPESFFEGLARGFPIPNGLVHLRAEGLNVLLEQFVMGLLFPPPPKSIPTVTPAASIPPTLFQGFRATQSRREVLVVEISSPKDERRLDMASAVS